MVSVRLTINTGFIEGLEDFVDEFDEMVREISEEVYKVHAPNILTLLRQSVARPTYPIEWKSERQRRFVLALLTREAKANGTYPDISYKPTGKLAAGWTSEVRSLPTGATLSFANPADFAEFAYGSLNQRSLGEAARPQQPFHKDRYVLAAEVIGDGFSEIRKDIAVEVSKRTDKEIKLIAKRRSKRPRRNK